MNLLQNSQYSWNIFFCRRIYGVRSQMNANLPKLTRRNIKSNKFAFGTPWQPDYPVYSRPLPSRKNWGDLSLSPIFFWGEGDVCTQATTGFIKLIYVISMEFLSLRRRRSSCIKAWLTTQTALQRNLYSLSKRRTLFTYLNSLETRTRWWKTSSLLSFSRWRL